jgi:peptidylamidoglycolate lyase
MTRLSALAACALVGCSVDEQVNPVPSPAYEVVHGWPEVPAGTILGQCSGVGIEASGDVLVFRRSTKDWFGGPVPVQPIAAPTVLRFDAGTGALAASLDAATFSMPHGLSVDGAGHLWLTDVSMHQVFELDASGVILRTWGERGVPGNDESHFDMPTDVAVEPDGTFYVSDGYGNARVAKFAPDGTFLKSWGTLGTMPGQFITPHSIALGPDGNVWVADRGNARVQVFDTEGNLQTIWEGTDLGRPWAITFDGEGHAFIADGGDQPAMPPDRARIIELDAVRRVIATFGGYGIQAGELIEPHDLAVGNDGAVYVVEVGIGRRTQKFVKTAMRSSP